MFVVWGLLNQCMDTSLEICVQLPRLACHRMSTFAPIIFISSPLNHVWHFCINLLFTLYILHIFIFSGLFEYFVMFDISMGLFILLKTLHSTIAHTHVVFCWFSEWYTDLITVTGVRPYSLQKQCSFVCFFCVNLLVFNSICIVLFRSTNVRLQPDTAL